MISWMRRRLFPRERATSPPHAPVASPHAPVASPHAPVASPAPQGPAHERDAAILEAIQKASRAQAKLSARLDALDSKIDGGFTDLRTAIGAGPAAPALRAAMRWDDLLDAVDLLEAATQTIDGAVDLSAADGLRGIVSRLDRFLAQAGLVRVRAPDRLADGKLFRVVGTESLPHLEDGVIARLVRCAVVDGDRLVREGEVIINRKVS